MHLSARRVLLGDNPAPVTFDEALAGLLALVGERVEAHVMDAGETPHVVATFGGKLHAGYSMTRGRAERYRSYLRPL